MRGGGASGERTEEPGGRETERAAKYALLKFKEGVNKFFPALESWGRTLNLRIEPCLMAPPPEEAEAENEEDDVVEDTSPKEMTSFPCVYGVAGSAMPDSVRHSQHEPIGNRQRKKKTGNSNPNVRHNDQNLNPPLEGTSNPDLNDSFIPSDVNDTEWEALSEDDRNDQLGLEETRVQGTPQEDQLHKDSNYGLGDLDRESKNELESLHIEDRLLGRELED
ncbi:hypothetical protein Syun_014123 [Stephania yunnanensis]|uniref:Uncharacterized protein n=1 Tax=Stephania yunnanensis TaxID=152371 RepID=A0AAP0JKE7_9MAGN